MKQIVHMDRVVIAYSDGSNNNNAKERPGGFGVTLRLFDNLKEISEGLMGVTNNQMELMGVIRILEEVTPGYKIRIHSDSQYSVKGGTTWVWEWEKFHQLEYKSNSELWRRFIQAYRRHPMGYVTLIWVKGHAGNDGNERVDQLAKKGYRENRNRTISQYLQERDKIMSEKDTTWKPSRYDKV